MNILGEEVATLLDEIKAAGEYEVRFDGTGFPSGLYFYRISTSGGFKETRRMVLLK
jgi:hypothetical protein